MIAAVIGFVAMSSQSAPVESSEVEASQTHVAWQYIGSSLDDIYDVENLWQRTNTPPTPCEGSSLPCTFMGPEDEEDFQTYLNQRTELQIVQQSSATKDP